LIAHAKTLASLVDGYPYETKLHSEYREVIKRLVEAGTAESPDAFAELLRQINEGAGEKKGSLGVMVVAGERPISRLRLLPGSS